MSGPDALDLDDTTRCPVGGTCAGCGTGDDLAVATAEMVLGVFCVTLCGRCVLEPLPPFAPVDAARLVISHCEHLGVDLDTMTAAALNGLR